MSNPKPTPVLELVVFVATAYLIYRNRKAITWRSMVLRATLVNWLKWRGEIIARNRDRINCWYRRHDRWSALFMCRYCGCWH